MRHILYLNGKYGVIRLAYAGNASISDLPTKVEDRPLRKHRLKGLNLLKYLGPAFIISVAYIDPGNFATNISGGSRFNYSLLWVILWSNIIAIFLQTMSAKLGIATGKNLPEMCAAVFSRKTNWVFWIVAEIGAMATDLAEFLGGTLGLTLLFRIPMWASCLITGLLTYTICHMEKYGQKIIEIVISVLIAVISGAYIIEIFLADPDWAQVAYHTLMPELPGSDAVFIAAGMLGATVMPHVIYLHSQLVQCRRLGSSDEDKKHHLRMEKIDIAIAMNIAFFVNAAMVVISAAVFFSHGMAIGTMEEAHRSLEPMLGGMSSGAFGIALLASGLSSSAVGTIAGQTIMKGFVGLSIPVQLRRLATMLPALVIIVMGINPMNALIWSQIALSFILPVPIVQMLYIAGKSEIMGRFANSFKVHRMGVFIALVVIILNICLILQSFHII